MDDALSQLDSLNETDMMAAFGETKVEEEIVIEDLPLEESEEEIQIENVEEDTESEDISIENIEEIAEVKVEDIEDNVENITDKSEELEEEIQIESIEEDTESENIIENITDKIDIPTSETVCTSTDLASLLSQLLNNKTIEITIKIKD